LWLPKAICRIEPSLERIKADDTLPPLAREHFDIHARNLLSCRLGWKRGKTS
jgi:hypothetical protein